MTSSISQTFAVSDTHAQELIVGLLRGVADILPEAAKKRGDEFGVAAMTPDQLLKSSDIDVVVNLTIPSTHYQVTMDALSAGKHAYSEKPFVLTLEEGKSVRKAAAERAMDDVRTRFGKDAVIRGKLYGRRRPRANDNDIDDESKRQ